MGTDPLVFTSSIVTNKFYDTRFWNKSKFSFVSIACIVNFIYFQVIRFAVNVPAGYWHRLEKFQSSIKNVEKKPSYWKYTRRVNNYWKCIWLLIDLGHTLWLTISSTFNNLWTIIILFKEWGYVVMIWFLLLCSTLLIKRVTCVCNTNPWAYMNLSFTSIWSWFD